MLTLAVGLIVSLIAAGEAPTSPLENLGTLDTRQLPEVSGIVKSRRFANTFWVHNDSGNPAALFAIRRDGTIIRRYRVEAANVDWEDIAVDDQGHLYLGDIGNNGGRLPMRVVYQIDEPDPSLAGDRPLKAAKASFYTFSRSQRFDAESLFVDQGDVFLVAKASDRREAELYEVPFVNPGTLFRPVVTRRVGALPELREPATGADLSPDRRLLAVCSVTVTRIYERSQSDHRPTARNESRSVRRWMLLAEVAYSPWPVEAICWDGGDLLLAGEDGRLARLPESVWRARSNAGSRSERRDLLKSVVPVSHPPLATTTQKAESQTGAIQD